MRKTAFVAALAAGLVFATPAVLDDGDLPEVDVSVPPLVIERPGEIVVDTDGAVLFDDGQPECG
jgi:hypothetical protein